MKVALYARVSTTNGQDPEMQLRELREYCKRRNWEVSDEYVDLGISGTKENGPSLADIETDALRQRQLRPVVDGVRGAAHVLLPCVGARFASASSLLLAAERAADLRAGRADVD